MSNLYLAHHGILGQKWGVRRYQNPDGTLTPEGRKRLYIHRTNKYVDQIDSSMSYDEKKRAGYDDPDNPKYTTEEISKYVVQRFIKKVGNKPVGYLDIKMDEDDEGKYTNVTIGVSNDPKYRNKGYGKELAKMGADWIKNSSIKDNFWTYRADNIASGKLAEYAGYKVDDRFDYTDKEGKLWKTAYLKNN